MYTFYTQDIVYQSPHFLYVHNYYLHKLGLSKFAIQKGLGMYFCDPEGLKSVVAIQKDLTVPIKLVHTSYMNWQHVCTKYTSAHIPNDLLWRLSQLVLII